MIKDNLFHKIYRNIPAFLGKFTRKIHITPIQEIVIKKIPSGSIIDIGAGGEGVIAQVGGSRITAIDKRQVEIDEAKDKAPDANWMLANATDLPFNDEEFDNATSFFCGMYMDEEAKLKSMKEIYRVLPFGGEFWIWDSKVDTKKKSYIIVLSISLPGKEKFKTGYGSKIKQDESWYREYLTSVGFVIEEMKVENYWFFIRAKKN